VSRILKTGLRFEALGSQKLFHSYDPKLPVYSAESDISNP